MATIDWPAALIPNAAAVGIRKGGVQFRGAFNSTLQAVDTSIAERLTLSCTLPQKRQADAGAVEAFLFQMAGGVNKVRAWHFGRPQPKGTLRGSPVLATALARGDATVSIGSAYNEQLLLATKSFDAAAWTKGGSTVPTPNTFTDPTGALTGDVLVENGATAQHYVLQAVTVPTSATQYTFSIYVAANGRNWVNLQLTETLGSTTAQAFFNLTGTSGTLGTVTGGANWSSVSAVITRPSLSDGWYRCSITGTKTNAAVAINVGVLAATADGVNSYAGSSASALALWGARMAPEAAAGSLTTPTLLAGDLFGVGNHLFMVQSDVSSNDSGVMSVPVVNRAREVVSVGTAVVWNKPTSLFVAPDMSAGVTHRPGMIDYSAIDLEESWP